ncbi:LysR family transcriptional regulator [soil metagenome]
MIDLSSLRHFLVVARCQSLAHASEQLHLTPSALSKSLKRLEQSLQTTLFDREGRGLKLNADGKQLEMRAASLLYAAEQLQAEFAGERHAFKCRIAGPALLQLGWGPALAEKLLLAYPKATLIFAHQDDRATIASVASGEHDLGLISIPENGILDASLALIVLASTEFRVCLSSQHPLMTTPPQTPVEVNKVMTYDFVVPLTPPFSTMAHLAAADGWRDDMFPRQIRYRTDDVLLMQQLVASGKALAYLPDYAIDTLGLHTLPVSNCPYFCRQKIALIYRNAAGCGWVNYMATQYENLV